MKKYLSNDPIAVPVSLIPDGFVTYDGSELLVIESKDTAAIGWCRDTPLLFSISPSERNGFAFVSVWNGHLRFKHSVFGEVIGQCQSGTSHFLTREAVAAIGLNASLEIGSVVRWRIGGDVVPVQRGVKKLEVSAAQEFLLEVLATN